MQFCRIHPAPVPLFYDLCFTGKDLFTDIGALVKGGLSQKVLQAFEMVRVIGNNVVHPEEINFNDNPEIAQTLFKLINFIVEEMITRPREITEINNSLPHSEQKEEEGRMEYLERFDFSWRFTSTAIRVYKSQHKLLKL